jgi:hypothetical protein
MRPMLAVGRNMRPLKAEMRLLPADVAAGQNEDADGRDEAASS